MRNQREKVYILKKTPDGQFYKVYTMGYRIFEHAFVGIQVTNFGIIDMTVTAYAIRNVLFLNGTYYEDNTWELINGETGLPLGRTKEKYNSLKAAKEIFNEHYREYMLSDRILSCILSAQNKKLNTITTEAKPVSVSRKEAII